MIFGTVQDLLLHQLRLLFSAEVQLHLAMPQIVQAAGGRTLSQALERYRLASGMHMHRVEHACKLLGDSATGTCCRGMEGLLEELFAAARRRGRAEIRDAALLAHCLRVVRFELASYANTRSLAHGMRERGIVRLLDQTLIDDESAELALRQLSEQALASGVLAAPPRKRHDPTPSRLQLVPAGGEDAPNPRRSRA